MQPADLVREQRIPACLRPLQLRVHIQRSAPDLHEVDAVRGGGREPDVQPADRLARGAVFVSLVRGDEEDLPALLAVPHGDKLQKEGLARAGHAQPDHVGVAVAVAVKDIEHTDRTAAPVTADEDAVLLAELHGVERERARHAGQQRVAPRLACDLRRNRHHRQEGMERLLLLVVTALADDILRGTETLHLRDACLQKLRCVRCDLDQGVHIVVILVRPVHLGLDILPGIDGAVHLLIVRTGIVHVPHPAAAPHGGVRHLGQYLFPRLPVQGDGERDPVPQPHERRQPAAAHQAAVAVARDVQIGVVHAVQFDAVPRGEVRRGGADQVHHAGGLVFFGLCTAFFPATFWLGSRFFVCCLHIFVFLPRSGSLCRSNFSRVRFRFFLCRSRREAVLQHKAEAYRQADVPAGPLAQHPEDRLHHLVVYILRLHHREPAAGEIPLCCGRNAVQLRVWAWPHVRFILVRDEEACGKGPVLHHAAHLPDIILDALPAQGICFPFPKFLHPSGVVLHIHRLGQAQELYPAGRDAQPGGKAADDALPLRCVLQEEVHRQYLEQPYQPAIPRADHAAVYIRDGQAALQVLICGREALRRAGLRAEDEFFYVHV